MDEEMRCVPILCLCRSCLHFLLYLLWDWSHGLRRYRVWSKSYFCFVCFPSTPASCFQFWPSEFVLLLHIYWLSTFVHIISSDLIHAFCCMDSNTLKSTNPFLLTVVWVCNMVCFSSPFVYIWCFISFSCLLELSSFFALLFMQILNKATVVGLHDKG